MIDRSHQGQANDTPNHQLKLIKPRKLNVVYKLCMCLVIPHNLDIRKSKVYPLLMKPNWTLITATPNSTPWMNSLMLIREYY